MTINNYYLVCSELCTTSNDKASLMIMVNSMFTIVELLDTNEQTSVRFCDIHLGVLSSGDTNQQNKIENYIFTRGQFWPSGIVFACVCVWVCVRVSVNHELVRAIIHQPFKLGSPNLDQRCKRPWLRSRLYCGMINGDLQGQIELKSQN